MEAIKNKKVSLIEIGQHKLYSELILLIIKHPNKDGFSYEDIKKRIRLEDAILNKQEDEEIILEDADLKFLQNLVSNFKWALYSRNIIQFTDDITSIKVK